MLDILKIVYQFDSHAATTFEISVVRRKLGNAGEKSYNSLIAQNGKRVKEYLKKDAILRENGKELFWGIFFDGEQLDGKNRISTEVTVGKSAESGGWSLNRNDLSEFLPVENYEGIYPINVDGIEAEGRFNINSRLFYKSDELKNHLEQLAKENPNQKIPLEIEFKDENKKGFQFKLKEELVKAIETLYEDLEVKYPHSFKLLEELTVDNEIYEEDGKSYDFYDYLKDEEFYFDKETIENYLLSLKVKPFVILTGNSGTGKTKLSQLFAHYLMEKNNESIFIKHKEETPSEYIDAKITLNQDGSAAVTKYLNNVLPLTDYQGRFDGFVEGVPVIFGFNVVAYLKFGYKFISEHITPKYGKDDEINIKIKTDDIKYFVSEPNFHGSSEINFKIGAFPDRRIKSFPKEEHLKFFNIDDKMKDCEVIVDGNITTAKFYLSDTFHCLKSDEGDKILEELSKRDRNGRFNIKIDFDSFKPHYPNGKENDVIVESLLNLNYKIIPVGANWTENRHIVGYYNVITNEYQSTPAYDLIKHADESDEPHFLILDEMNLSHVERYFADFLSAIESKEEIPLYGSEPLTLPQNLSIIGTVNVDETTYMFSPKVLDRANVLEFKTSSAKDYMMGDINPPAPEGNIPYLENPLSDVETRKWGIDKLKDIFENVTVDGENFWIVLSNEIETFQSILKESNFDFGFRVINEIVRFMVVAWKYENKPQDFSKWERYFDACIKQKMLPKLHGSEKIIGSTLKELHKLCVVKDDNDEDILIYPESARKLKEMRKVLKDQRYVSFIN